MKRTLVIFNFKDNSLNIYGKFEDDIDITTLVVSLGYDVSDCDYYWADNIKSDTIIHYDINEINIKKTNKLEIEYYPIGTKLYELQFNNNDYTHVNNFYIREYTINIVEFSGNIKDFNIKYTASYNNCTTPITVNHRQIGKKYFISKESLLEKLNDLKIEKGI